MTKKAVAYVSDIILGRTGDLINRQYQKAQIEKYARENDIEIVAWFEDEMYCEDCMSRPGVKALLSCDKEYNTLLCERVWAFSRSMQVLEPLLKTVEAKKIRLESATTMWDCVSQNCRRRFNPSLRPFSGPATPVVVREEGPGHVKKPARLNFANLVPSQQKA